MGQDKLLMLLMGQNIFVSPAVSRSECPHCLKTILIMKTVYALSKLDIAFIIRINATLLTLSQLKSVPLRLNELKIS